MTLASGEVVDFVDDASFDILRDLEHVGPDDGGEVVRPVHRMVRANLSMGPSTDARLDGRRQRRSKVTMGMCGSAQLRLKSHWLARQNSASAGPTTNS